MSRRTQWLSARGFRTWAKSGGPSALERDFALKWKAVGGQELVSEHRFDPDRRWRFDFAHPESLVAIELEGGIWSGGRHTRGAGFEADCEKYNAAQKLGWQVYRLTADMVTTAECESIKSVINARMK